MATPNHAPKTDAELWDTVINQSGMIASCAKSAITGLGFNVVAIAGMAMKLNAAAVELQSRAAGNAPKKISL